MRILSAEAMREVDRRAIEEVGIPSLVLMENAALGLVEAVADLGEAVRAVVIVCGPGNNGGDGLALARHLDARGYAVEVFLVARGKQPRGDAGVQLGICRKQGLPLTEVGPEEPLTALLASAREADLVVDALFGTGLGRPLEGQYAELVERLSELPVRRLAVDLPSGLAGSRSELTGPCFRAHLTVTFAAPKPATLFAPAAEACGEVVVTDLGIPPRLVEEAPEAPEVGGALHLLVAEELAPLLVPRDAAGHKGTYGHALLVAGSPGKAGAAILAARAAVRAGAGLVTAAVPEAIVPVVDGGSVESMTLPLPATPGGGLSARAVEAVLAAAEGKEVLALGPGLGQEAETAEAIRRIVLAAPLPLVLDADGVNAFAGRARELAERRAPTFLTPHPGELGRLLGRRSDEIQADRVASARRAARDTAATVVLKGHQSLVAAPGGAVWVVPTGNPGMGSGGTGDVLTGLLAGLLAQAAAGGRDLEEAVRLGVYLHGLTGDLAAEGCGERSLAAGDLVGALPEAFARLAAS